MTKNNRDYLFQVDFCLKAKNQKRLIDALMVAANLNKCQLANLLDLSWEKVLNTLSGISFLKKDEAERLVKYFCLYFGG